ncbi:MAG: teichoic acid transporter [Enterovirga sp.]|nr:teichoic acid transporter [Enterovirga sp.]
MTFVVVFLVNACLSFALSLVVAWLVGPDSFGRYALGLSISVVVNTALFEWLRLSATRFYSERVRTERPAVKATLDRAYGAAAALLVLATAVLAWAGADLGLSAPLLLAAAGAGLAVGLFDYQAALARARFLDRRYAVLLVTRAGLAFVLTVGAGWLTGDPAIVLGAAAAASFAAVLLLRPRDASAAPAGGAGWDRAQLATFARYGLPLVAASAIYQLLPLLSRGVLASRAGFAEAGYFSLATEIAVRLFQNLGSALDLALFQLAVRAEERHGREAAERQVGRNVAAIAAIVLPATAGLWLVWPAFEAVFVPPAFRGQVAGAAALAIPAFAAYGLVQYALNPVFQLRRRTGPVIGAALVALALNAGLLLLWPDLRSATGIAAAQLASFCAALAVLAAACRAPLPWRDLGLALLSAAAMAGALWPLRDLAPPAVALPLLVAAGAVIYGGLAVLLDVAGARRLAAQMRAGLARRGSAGRT